MVLWPRQRCFSQPSFPGGYRLHLNQEQTLKQIIFVMVSLAVGSLFGDAFIHLLP